MRRMAADLRGETRERGVLGIIGQIRGRSIDRWDHAGNQKTDRTTGHLSHGMLCLNVCEPLRAHLIWFQDDIWCNETMHYLFPCFLHLVVVGRGRLPRPSLRVLAWWPAGFASPAAKPNDEFEMSGGTPRRVFETERSGVFLFVSGTTCIVAVMCRRSNPLFAGHSAG
jgi:hypothetical protein